MHLKVVDKKVDSIKSVKNGHNRCGTPVMQKEWGVNSICRVFKIGINSLQGWIRKEGKESAKKLIDQVPNMKIYSTDNGDAYGCAIEAPKIREIGKRNTQDSERLNLRMRMVLARLQRKTIKFFKSWERLEYSVNLVINRYNHQLL